MRQLRAMINMATSRRSTVIGEVEEIHIEADRPHIIDINITVAVTQPIIMDLMITRETLSINILHN